MEKSYNAQEREEYWTQKWVEDKLYQTPDNIENPEDNEYVLDMFPYPSGSGLHVGHPMGYVGSDIYARLRRMQGKNVLHPMGYDAFGLPAEQFAIETNNHPRNVINSAVTSFRAVMQRLGLSYDWDREVNTADPDYYKWTQWIFAKLYERGLAEYKDVDVTWCPALGTVVANDEIEEDGTSKRGGFPTERTKTKQWVLKIADYAQRLLDDLEELDWPEHIKEAQRQHIGRSEGLEVTFDIDGEPLNVFTTHPETLYGVTFLVLSTEHPLLDKLTLPEHKEAVHQYLQASANLSDRDRMMKEKTGVFTGSEATNPLTGEKVQIWVGDYVKGDYATGAIMGVPTGDERDREFAEKYGIPKREIYVNGAYRQKEDDPEGVLMNSGILNGKTELQAREAIQVFVEEQGFGKRTVNYNLRDWTFSRQRFWGEPFPIIHHSDGSIGLVDMDELPVTLPELENFKPMPSDQPTKVLDRATDWVQTPEGMRETNTMPGAAGSSWYFLRYIDPRNNDKFAELEKLKAWLPVDQYIGGAEHTTGHVLYARFWHKVLYDLGVVPTKEPFKHLTNQGTILTTEYVVFKDGEEWVDPKDVKFNRQKKPLRKADHDDGKILKRVSLAEGDYTETDSGEFVLTEDPSISVKVEHPKMSKSKPNVVPLNGIIDEHGADVFRMYEMQLGPFEANKVWDTEGIQGVKRWMKNVLRIFERVSAEATMDNNLKKELNACIKKVTDDTVAFKFNTAIAAMMDLVNNKLKNVKQVPPEFAQILCKLIAPYAPMLSEEIWCNTLGQEYSVHKSEWPEYDECLATLQVVQMVVQVNGKVRATIDIDPAHASDEELVAQLAQTSEKVVKALGDKPVEQRHFVPGRLINLVTKK